MGVDPYSGAPSAYFFSFAILALLPPAVSAASRRAHDFGQSGWLAALTLIPYVGWIAALVFVFVPGQNVQNQHGPNPKTAAAAI